MDENKKIRILVLGASGRIGRLVVDYALSKGYEVTGFYRASEEPGPLVTTVIGDANNPNDVEGAIKNCDVVISCLGHVKGGPADMQTRATKLVVESMQKHNVKRFISLTGTGARFTGDTPSMIDRILNFGVRTVDPDRMNDGQAHLDYLASTDIDWTVVRILKYASIKPSKNLRLTAGGPARLLTSRQQIAETLVSQVESNDWIKRTPILS